MEELKEFLSYPLNKKELFNKLIYIFRQKILEPVCIIHIGCHTICLTEVSSA